MDRFIVAKNIQAATAPGQWYSLKASDVDLITPIPGFSVGESIMENIVGSAYEWSFTEASSGDITFRRRATPLGDGRRTFVSADRRHLFTQGSDGLWTPKR